MRHSTEYIPAVALAGNAVSSVAIVFVNKCLIDVFHFRFVTTLTAMHFIASALVFRRGSLGVALESWKRWGFSVVASISIVSLNTSLFVNSVFFYQASKLLIIPLTAVMESILLKTSFRRTRLGAAAVTVLGVACVIFDDMQLRSTSFGVSVAVVSIFSSSLQQICVRMLLSEDKLSAAELLASIAPSQALLLLLMGPFLDRAYTKAWFVEYEWSVPAISAIMVSCILAILVNFSQFACLGKFTALSFQVLGHTKSVAIFLISWKFLGEQPSPLKISGSIAAIGGLILYGAT